MQIRRSLVAHGFYEARSLSLIEATPDYMLPGAMQVRNPLASDQVLLRPTLVRGVLAAVAHNARAGLKAQRIFELGRCFLAGEREEQTKLALAMTGPLAEKSWRGENAREADFFDLKGVLASLGWKDLETRPMENPALALCAEILFKNVRIGAMGLLWPARARELDVAASVVIAEIGLPPADAEEKKFCGISKYPVVTRDIAMLAPKNCTHAELTAVLQNANEPLLADVELFDVFSDPSGEKVPREMKALAYSLTYRSAVRTLTADEVNEAHTRLKERLKAALHVSFRE
jgi:phenylalanyl-tRNA synthetase beta chain